jgi:hypothetical protein
MEQQTKVMLAVLLCVKPHADTEEEGEEEQQKLEITQWTLVA